MIGAMETVNKQFGAFRVGDICIQLRGKEASPNKVPDGSINMVNEISTSELPTT